jgi:hypothetical protein
MIASVSVAQASVFVLFNLTILDPCARFEIRALRLTARKGL